MFFVKFKNTKYHYLTSLWTLFIIYLIKFTVFVAITLIKTKINYLIFLRSYLFEEQRLKKSCFKYFFINIAINQC